MNQYYQPEQRSTFVSVIAWIFIILSGMTVLSAILQSTMMSVMFSMEPFQESFKDPAFGNEAPFFFTFMFKNMLVILYCFLAASALLFVSSIGLLLRKQWGRSIFICYMYLGIIGNVAGIILYEVLQYSMADIPDTPYEFNTIMVLFRIFSYLGSIGFAVLYGWIIHKLGSEEIKEEFE